MLPDPPSTRCYPPPLVVVSALASGATEVESSAARTEPPTVCTVHSCVLGPAETAVCGEGSQVFYKAVENHMAVNLIPSPGPPHSAVQNGRGQNSVSAEFCTKLATVLHICSWCNSM